MGPGEKTKREAADLSAYPDMLVIYLGMRARSFQGVRAIMKLGPQIRKAVDEKPDGLLRHDRIVFSMAPLHVGMRQYWRDVDAMLAWSSTLPHKEWWTDFLKSSQGTTFWHETYFAKGGFESIYDDLPETNRDFGFPSFAPMVPVKGSTFSKFRKAARAKSD